MLTIPEAVTKKAVEGFESIRVLGPVGMFRRTGAQHEAQQRGYEDLAYLSKEDYKFIVANYHYLMDHYEIERGIVCAPSYVKNGGPQKSCDCEYPTCPDDCPYERIT